MRESVAYGELLRALKDASTGNGTRAARVAGEHSTTEPPMHRQSIIFVLGADRVFIIYFEPAKLVSTNM